jgi:tetratricopeptide (TPR) repeat protein
VLDKVDVWRGNAPIMSVDFTLAVSQAESAAARGSSDPRDYLILGWHCAQRGDFDGALARLSHGLGLSPRHPEILLTMGAVFRQQGRLRDAVLHCDAAIEAKPDYADAWLERGFVLAAGGSMDAARACYERTALLDPRNAAAFAGLASLAARNGDSAVGRDYAKKALTLDPGNLIASCALATMEIESGNWAAAETLLTPVVARLDQPSADRALALGLLADALNKLEKTDEAFAAYGNAKADFAAIHARRFAGRDSHRTFIEAIGAQIPSMDVSAWMPSRVTPPHNAAATHIFLLGYPRSGTTMVENILASLSDVSALEERPTLAAADAQCLAARDGLIRMADLPETAIDPLRQAYWDKVAESGAEVAGKVFVDMDPLKGTRLPLIARLFPDAKILIMRRDPRDVVWSCFHTNFALTSAALEFTTLESTARHYDALMRLTEAALETFKLNTHVVHYDGLVRDFDGETQAMCAFLGLTWSPTLRDFSRTAKARGVSTASAGQVRKGLYDGTRQWERYRAHLAPILPILRPWIERFGFEA